MFQSYIEKVNQLKDKQRNELHSERLRLAEFNREQLLNTLRSSFPIFYNTFTDESIFPTERLDYIHNFVYIHLPTHINSKRDEILPAVVIANVAIGLDGRDLIVGKWNGYNNPMQHVSFVNKNEEDIRLAEALNYISMRDKIESELENL